MQISDKTHRSFASLVGGFTLACAFSPCDASASGAAAPPVLRTRSLPALAQGVEPELAARAQSTAGPRLHAIVEVSPAARALAESEECRLLLSIDGDLWLASLPVAPLARGESIAGVTRAWALAPEDRRDPSWDFARVAPRAIDGRLRLRVKAFPDVAAEEVRAFLESMGATLAGPVSFPGVHDVLFPEAALPALLSCDLVRWVEPAAPPPEFANNDMRLATGVDVVQGQGYGGLGIHLGMWDSGTPDPLHPDLVGRITAGQGGLSTVLHSTHVAGVAIGDGTNSQAHGGGGLQWRGVAHEATLVVYDAVGATAEVAGAIQSHDIDLMTNSWVYPVTPTDCSMYGAYAFDAPEFDAIVRGSAGKPLPVVFAAGNERDDGDCGLDSTGGYRSLPPPATAKNVISVGANHSDAGYMTLFSSWGPTDDGRMKPDVAAPGCQVSGDHGITSTEPGGGYFPLCGTSQSAPVVSGSIAILLEEWRARFAGDPLPSTFKAVLGGFALDRANPGPDYRFGLGAIRLDRSMHELRTATTVEDALAHGQTDSWTFAVPAAAETLVVTIAWDDPPGAEMAALTLVNDLDLELESPSAATFAPFVLNPANPIADATTGVNIRDNVEQVRVIAPAPGVWTARVTGTSVPDGPQLYSLAGFDRRPPAGPAAFAALAVSDASINLSWIRPADADRAGTLVVRSTSPVGWTPSEGVAYPIGSEPVAGVRVVFASDADHSAVPFTDGGLASGTTYFYAGFSFDEVPNYSPASFASATTTSSVDAPAPVVPAAPARVRLVVEGANPFRESTALRFELPRESRFTLSVHDARGRRVATLRQGVLGPGAHRVSVNARGDGGAPLAAGVYFVRLEASGESHVAKILLLR